jgi:hypothetical protein
MERFQIYLEKAQREKLEQLARRKGCRVSQLVRKAVDAYVELEEQAELPTLKRIEDHPLWGLVGMIKDPAAPDDMSVNHDAYIYGHKKV